MKKPAVDKKPVKKTKPKTKKVDHKAEVDKLTKALEMERADLISFRQRAEINKRQSVARAEKEILTKLLEVFDNLQRAVNQPLNQNLKKENWVVGVLAISKQLIGNLSQLNLQIIQTVGKQFNPETMEAVGVVYQSDLPENQVVNEIRTGYLYQGELLRPAQVEVSSKDKPDGS